MEMIWADPGMMPMRKPRTVPRPIGLTESLNSSLGREEVAKLRFQDFPAVREPGGGQDLRYAEKAHGHGHDSDPVAQGDQAVRKTEIPAHLVDADHSEHQSENDHGQVLHDRPARHVAEDDEPAKKEAAIFRGAESEGEFRQRGRQKHQPHDAERPGDIGSDRRHGQSRTRPSLLGHGVPVDAGHDRSRFAGNAHENGSRRPAVHGAVVNPRQENDRRGGVQAEGRGQKHADPGQGTHPGQNADHGPDQTADQGVKDVRRRKNRGKTQNQILQAWLPSEPPPPPRQGNPQKRIKNPKGPQGKNQR